jgi:hypothetical protein
MMIDRYSILAWSSKSTAQPGPVVGILFWAADRRLGQAYFYPDGAPLDPPGYDEEYDMIELRFTLSLFPAILQMLREEKPVYLFRDRLDTDAEPVGEEERSIP